MNDREQLREKISEISNSHFPLIDFFNDIGTNEDPRYNKELAYQDIEKIYNVFMYYREKSEKLEKALNLFFYYIDAVRPLSFDSYISCECSKEEFDLILELMKKYLEELESD